MSLALEELIYGLVGLNVNETQTIQNQIAALQEAKFQTAVLNTLSNLDVLLNSVSSNVDLLLVRIATLQASVTALGNPAQAGVPVDVSVTSQGDIAAQVWGFTVPTVGPYDIAQDVLTVIGRALLNYTDNNLPVPFFAPFFLALFDMQSTYPFGLVSPPAVELSTVLATDSVLTWLQREAPALAWAINPTYGGRVAANDAPNAVTWICVLDQGQFADIQAALFPGTVEAAPVWPGLAQVTLGAPVALALGVTITAPMDGVLIHITAAPLKQGYFTFDNVKSYRNVGALAFFSDDGQEEFPQTLGFQDAVYACKTMKRAAGVKVRTSVGLTGTIIPWTIVG